MGTGEKLEAGAAEELTRLRRRVDLLEREKVQRDEEIARRSSPALLQANQLLLRQIADMEEQLRKVTEENRDFASLCVQVQEQNEAITNLYVASHRLHATLDCAEVMRIIKEILIELVGAEEFAILLRDDKSGRLQVVAEEGASNYSSDEHIVGEVASSGQPFFRESSERDARSPLAAIPLNFNANSVGVIVIYKLLNQKGGFSYIDYQLLQLLAAHAATALVSARLHQAMDRKLKTMEGFVQLMKSH